MKELIKKMPIVGSIARAIYCKCIRRSKRFPGSKTYWLERYESGGTSGDGSYDKLAVFKAEILNEFVEEKGIKTIIEYGCGDGNQLMLAKYPSYIGFDISPKAISICRKTFCDDDTKTFRQTKDHDHERAELTLSLDVIYHLVEDGVFVEYINQVFDSSDKYVIVYASNTDDNPADQFPHVKHRKFTDWVDRMKPMWKLARHIPNKYPFNGDSKTGSFADFYVYRKI